MFNSLLTKILASSNMTPVNTEVISTQRQEAAVDLPLQSISNQRLVKCIAQLKAEARRYEHGFGVVVDMQKAINLYREGAELGGAFAIYKLARFYAEGIYIPQNCAQAALWYKKGMQQHPKEPVFSSKYEDMMFSLMKLDKKTLTLDLVS